MLMAEPMRCHETVYVRDVPRYTGRHRRGNSGFEMHYTRRHCRRIVKQGGFCWQHKDNHDYAHTMEQQQ